MSVTMKEIANIAGVSRQAVAAVLSGSGSSRVSSTTRERIRHLAASLHYIPNGRAQSLKGAGNRTIGVYGVPYASVLEQCFFHELSCRLSLHNYNLMASYGHNGEMAEQALYRLYAKGIDGIIVTSQDNPLQKSGLPPVPSVYVPYGKLPGYDVVVDHAAGTRKAVEYLLLKGCRKFTYLAASIDGFYNRPNQEKFRGFNEAVSAAGGSSTLLTVQECHGDGKLLVQRLLKCMPDAVFCCNDYFAGRLMVMLMENGVRIPEDMKIVGYDGLSMCDLCAVPLATIVQPLRRVTECAVDLLLERIARKETAAAPANIDVEPFFYPSVSCGEMNEKINKLPVSDSYSLLENCWLDT